MKLLAENLEERVYPAYPLLRPVLTLEEERSLAEKDEMWRLFLESRESCLMPDRAPNKDDLTTLTAHALLWFEQMQKRYGVVGGDGLCNYKHLLWGGYVDLFKTVLSDWRAEWWTHLDRFVPTKYRQKFDDKDGIASMTDDPFNLLFTTRPVSYDNKGWRYRRWLARRDWFLGNLGLLVNFYKNSFEFYDIGIKFDNYLRLDDDTFMETDFSQKYNLPARKLHWGGKIIPVHCDWDKKDLFSLIQKIILKQYNGHKDIFLGIYDMQRARLSSETKDIPTICDFIEKKTDLSSYEENNNKYTDPAWQVIRYKGLVDKNDPKSRFELQIQDVEVYNRVKRTHTNAHPIFYKGRQFFPFLMMLFPPTLMGGLFDINFNSFREDFMKRCDDLVTLDILSQEI